MNQFNEEYSSKENNTHMYALYTFIHFQYVLIINFI